jgi:hypothetical protein
MITILEGHSVFSPNSSILVLMAQHVPFLNENTQYGLVMCPLEVLFDGSLTPNYVFSRFN